MTPYDAAYAQFSVRPAVVLKACVRVTGGTGAKATPYTLSNSNC